MLNTSSEYFSKNPVVEANSMESLNCTFFSNFNLLCPEAAIEDLEANVVSMPGYDGGRSDSYENRMV